MRAWLKRAALVLLLACAAEVSEAAPEIEVRARTVVQLKPIVRTRFGFTIRGTITDRSSPEPVVDSAVLITIDDETHSAFSDENGDFELTVRAEEGSYRIDVSFPGDGLYDPSSQTLEKFNVENEPLELSLTATRTEDERWEIAARSQSAGIPVAVSMILWGGDVSAPELARLADLESDLRGRAVVTLTQETLGGFGDKRIEVRFGGDDTYDPATASASFSIDAETTTSLSLEETELAFEDTIVGRGVVIDEAGEPLEGHRVVLEAGGAELAESSTDEKGKFRIEVEASELGQGKMAIQAAVFPRVRWLSVSRSEPVAVSIDEKKPVPIAATLAAFGATLAALLAFVAFRTKPWTRWLERFSKRDPEVAKTASENVKHRAPGLSPARPSLVSALRRPSDFGFTGSVFDVITARPIGHATVRLQNSAGETRELVTGADGAFAAEDLGGGGWTVKSSARGYLPESFEIVVPHKGELRSAHIELLSVREHIFDLYGEVAKPLLPGEDRWGVWTPRQIFEHVRSRHRADAFRGLTDAVEELYFSQRIPDVDAVAGIKEQISGVAHEIADVDSPR